MRWSWRDSRLQAELAYLATQPLGRFATASATGQPDVAVVIFGVDDGCIVTAGFDITRTVRYRNAKTNPRAVFIVDDLAGTDPWSPRGIKVRGSVAVEAHEGGERFRITPEVIWSWGVEEPAAGIPQMTRRTV